MVVIKIGRGATQRIIWILALLILAGGLTVAFFHLRDKILPSTTFELNDELGGNIFPSLILSTATTDTLIVAPTEKGALGNPKSGISIQITSPVKDARLHVEVAETPFFKRSVSEFILPEEGKAYTVYPDILWNYDALRNNTQAEPITVSVEVQIKDREASQRVRTFSVRSINECLIGYNDKKNRFHNTGVLFAAYVNEDSPLIDKILREALNTRIVNRFMGYQNKRKDYVDKQVYALWNVLQRRKFRYSSISYSSLSSNVVYSQRVRTLEDALASSQINCVDGSVLFASLLRAINIDPILVRIPGHMYVGYYTDRNHSQANFLETTMIGDIDLDDFFPEEKLDSTSEGKSQEEMSRLTFEKSKEYAHRKYSADSARIHTLPRQYMFLEISKALRRKIQPLGK